MKRRAADAFDEYELAEKKEHEKHLVEGVLARLGFSNFSTGTEKTQEKPDVIVAFRSEAHSTTLGCEIRLLYSDEEEAGSPLRRFWAVWTKIARRVNEELGETSTFVPYCAIEFHESSFRVDLSPRQRIEKELVKAGQVLRQQTELVISKDAFPTLSPLIKRIRVIDQDGGGRLWWPTHIQSGSVPPMETAVKRAVREKSRLARDYNWKDASQRWLLLVAEARGTTDVIGGARSFALPQAGAMAFDAVLVWDRFTEDVWLAYPAFRVLCNGATQTRDVNWPAGAIKPFLTGGILYPTRFKGAR